MYVLSWDSSSGNDYTVVTIAKRRHDTTEILRSIVISPHNLSGAICLDDLISPAAQEVINGRIRPLGAGVALPASSIKVASVKEMQRYISTKTGLL